MTTPSPHHVSAHPRNRLQLLSVSWNEPCHVSTVIGAECTACGYFARPLHMSMASFGWYCEACCIVCRAEKAPEMPKAVRGPYRRRHTRMTTVRAEPAELVLAAVSEYLGGD